VRPPENDRLVSERAAGLPAAVPGVSVAAAAREADLAALDAAWEEAAVRFGPGEAMDGCSTDRLRSRLRAASCAAA